MLSYGCIRLTSIVIPASVTEIEFGAFYVNNIPENIKAKIIAKFGDKVFGNEYAWINLSLK